MDIREFLKQKIEQKRAEREALLNQANHAEGERRAYAEMLERLHETGETVMVEQVSQHQPS